MFEQDYIIRIIKEMVRAVLKLLLNIDTENPTAELLEEDEEEQNIFNNLLDMVDEGQIDRAENIVYEMTLHGDKTNLKVALLFYSYLNDQEDKFLQEHNFSREEISTGISDLASRYGLTGIADIFLM